MENKANQEAIDYILTVDELSKEEKSIYIKNIMDGENPAETLDAIEDNLQKKLDNTLGEAGVELDENDPEYKAAQKKMMDEIESAEKEFKEDMSDIGKEVKKIEKETGSDIQKIIDRN